MKALLLDDVRTVNDTYLKMGDAIYMYNEWDVVKSYDEFVAYIEKNGLPEIISFDHDLCNEHYINGAYFGYKYFNYEACGTKTGKDTAEWLVENYDVKDVIFRVHSHNPYGTMRINKILNEAKNGNS